MPHDFCKHSLFYLLEKQTKFFMFCFCANDFARAGILARATSHATQLAPNVQQRDETDETEAHHEHDERRDLQTRRVVCVEAKHAAAHLPTTATTTLRSRCCSKR